MRYATGEVAEGEWEDGRLNSASEDAPATEAVPEPVTTQQAPDVPTEAPAELPAETQ